MKKAVLIFLIAVARSVNASDTLHITLTQADSLFQKNNFFLLAASARIEMQQALLLQTQLFSNPVLTLDVNAYNPERKQYWDTGPDGQKAAQVEKLIRLGGKRQKEMDVAKTDLRISENEFRELIRNLKFRLHSGLVDMNQKKVLLRKFDSQLDILDTLISAYQVQSDKGNIALKDIVRLKGVYLSLNNDRAEVLREYYGLQTEIQSLLGTEAFVELNFEMREFDRYVRVLDITELQRLAMEWHPEVALSGEMLRRSGQVLALEKSKRMPDLSVFAAYDQRGGAFNHQLNAGIALPLPLFNLNKGNIRAAQAAVDESQWLLRAKKNEIANELNNNYSLYVQTVAEFNKVNTMFSDDFERVLKSISENFQKRNVSILEFVDFFESYNSALSELARARTQLVIYAELLSLSVGTDIF